MTFQTSVVTDVVVGNNFVHKRSAVCVVAPSPCYRFLSRLIAVMSHPVVRNYEILMLCETCVKSFYFFLVFFAQPRVETLALLSLLEVRVRYSWFSIGASRPRSPQKLFFVLLILILVPASAHLSCTYICPSHDFCFVQAFGTTSSTAACKNSGTRAVIFAVKEVAENNSSFASKVRDTEVGAPTSQIFRVLSLFRTQVRR